MTQPTVTPEILESLDVRSQLAAKITLDLVALVDVVADSANLVLGQVIGAGRRVDPCTLDDLERARPTNPKDVRQRNVDSLASRQIYA